MRKRAERWIWWLVSLWLTGDRKSTFPQVYETLNPLEQSWHRSCKPACSGFEPAIPWWYGDLFAPLGSLSIISSTIELTGYLCIFLYLYLGWSKFKGWPKNIIHYHSSDYRTWIYASADRLGFLSSSFQLGVATECCSLLCIVLFTKHLLEHWLFGINNLLSLIFPVLVRVGKGKKRGDTLKLENDPQEVKRIPRNPRLLISCDILYRNKI